MFPQTDELSNIISDTIKVMFKRRLVDRMLRLWTEMARGQRCPRRDQIEPSKLDVDWTNCLVIAVKSPVHLVRGAERIVGRITGAGDYRVPGVDTSGRRMGVAVGEVHLVARIVTHLRRNCRPGERKRGGRKPERGRKKPRRHLCCSSVRLTHLDSPFGCTVFLLLRHALVRAAVMRSGAAVEIAAVEEQPEERRVRRQDHGRAFTDKAVGRFHGAHKGIEIGRLAQRFSVDARGVPFSFAPALLRHLDRLAEDARLLLLRPRPNLQSFLLALRSILHADAPAFGFHSGVGISCAPTSSRRTRPSCGAIIWLLMAVEEAFKNLKG